jgi:undecaprenyl-phosphate galactose phosphotransferase
MFKFFLFGVLLTLFFKRLFKRLLFSFDIFKIKVKLIAKTQHLKALEQEVQENWYFGYKVCEKECNMILISSKAFDVASLQKTLHTFLHQTKDIYIIPYVDHIDFSHTTILDFSNIRLSAIHIENRLLNKENIFVKNIFEELLVLFIFPFALFVHMILWVAIRLDSPGNVLFKQKRLGKNGKPFSCYKYRTMHTESESLLKNYLDTHPQEVEHYRKYHKYKNDPRITKLGKFLRKTSLDEFPQFYNILRGDMNLIGPRPYMLSEKAIIGEDNLDIILASKPGLTGLWQVNGRNELTFQERVQLDIWYIQNWSLWIDFVIFIKTIKVVLLKIGAK